VNLYCCCAFVAWTPFCSHLGTRQQAYRAAQHRPPPDISHPRSPPPSSIIPSVIQVTHLDEWCRVSHGYLAMPRSSFSFTMLNLGSVSWSSFCFSSIFSRSFCRSFNRRFWRIERRDRGGRARERGESESLIQSTQTEHKIPPKPPLKYDSTLLRGSLKLKCRIYREKREVG